MRRIWPLGPRRHRLVYTWTGLYWGVNVGYSWGEAKNDATLQVAPGVFGTRVGDPARSMVPSGASSRATTISSANGSGASKPTFRLLGRKGSDALQIAAGVPPTFLNTEHKLTWFGTSRSRLGVLWTPNTLLYGTFGVAYGQVKEDAVISRGPQSASLNFKDTKAGWTAGAGVESTIGGGWTAKLEYLYMDLGKTESTVATPGLGTLVNTSRRFTDNIVRVGFNYKWGGGGYGGGMDIER